MKRTLHLILCAIILMPCLLGSANASGGLLIQTNRINAMNGKQTTESPDDMYVKDVVFFYYDSLGIVTFEEVKEYLDEKKYSYDASLGSDFSFCKIVLDLEEGEISILFYPLDASPNSTAFGDPAKEYITLIQYDRGEDWLSIADGLHTMSRTMQAVYHARGNNSFEFELVSDLVNFYNYNLGGAIIFDESMAYDVASVQKVNSIDADTAESDWDVASLHTPFTVPPGEYVVGDDIPEGTYRLEVADTSKTAVILINEPGEYGKTVLYETIGKYGGSNIVGKIQLRTGYLVYVSAGEILFLEYTGLK